jgi:Zn-dependent protease with chaperone function
LEAVVYLINWIRRSSVRWILATSLLFVLSGANNVRATQQANDSEDDPPIPSLHVSLSLDNDGRMTGSIMDFTNRHSPGTLKSALQSALGCTLQDASRRPLPNLFYGTCTQPTTGTVVHQLRIATGPLVAYARENKLSQISLSIHLPDVDFAETDPPASNHTVYPAKVSAAVRRALELNRVYLFQVDNDSIPEFLFVRIGYRQNNLIRIAATLLAVLFVPVLLVAWLGRRALDSDAPDKAPLWFSYMRSLSLLLNVSMMGWWIASESFHLAPILRFLSAGSALAGTLSSPFSAVAVNWMPPVISWILCFALSAPVQQQLRGLSWTRRELATQALFSFTASMLPLILFLTGLRTITTGAFRAGLVWFVAAAVVRTFANQALVKFLGMQPHALTTGDLRDRAFAMAQQLGVKLQQLYVIPSGKGQMANAFARTGNTIAFTDLLLQRMSRREVDYVLAHEMSHLKLGHPGKLAGIRVGTIVAIIFAFPYLRPFLHDSVLLRYAIIFALATIVPYFWSRRYEYAADAGAVAATRDPEAAISALFKLAQLNLHPIHWSHWTEKWLTHPSSLRRAQAIARSANISADLIPEIAKRLSAVDDRYPLPASAAAGAKVHSSHRKQAGIRRNSYLLVAALVLPSCVFAFAATHLPSAQLLSIALYGLGFFATIGAYLLLANYGSVMGNRKLVPDLKRKLAQQRISAEAWDGIFIGFSPSNVPKIYELNTNWDVGCLFIRSDRLCYVGEEIQFSLQRHQITDIALGAGFPGLLRPKRLYVAWKDDEAARSGVFNIGCLDGSSALRLRRDLEALAKRLDLWRKSSPVARTLPPQLSGLTAPVIGNVTSASVDKIRKPRKLLKELYWTVLFACVGATLFGLPFHLLLFLLPIRSSAAFAGPGAGWYVIGVALTVRIIAMLPAMLYKEHPAVAVPKLSSEPLLSAVAPAGDASPKPVETEPVGSR